MKLKLPTSKKERIEVLVVVAVALIGGGIMAVNLGIKPYLEKRKEMDAEYATMQATIGEIQTDLKSLGGVERRVEETAAEIDRIAAAYIPKPTFDSFIIGIRDRMSRHASAAGITMDSANIRQLRIQALPKGKKHRIFKAYIADVSLTCNYADLLRLIETMERENPYISVASLTISAQPDIPEKHSIRMALMWPVWAKPRVKRTTPETDENKEG